MALQLRAAATALLLAWHSLPAAALPAGSRPLLSDAGRHLEESSAPPGPPPPQYPQYLAVCAAIRERPEDVLQWVEYHAALGVQKFYLMLTDDPEADAMEAALKPHIDSGVVELFPLPRVTPRTVPLLQVRLYNICLQSVRERHRFVGFWDADEFLVPLDPAIASLPSFLLDFELHGGVGVNWRTVGPSGHLHRPTAGGILESYLTCTPWDWPVNEEVKSIVNTAFVEGPTSDPHSFTYSHGAFAVDGEGREISGTKNPLMAQDWREHRRPPRLALYHFVTKSAEEYREKMRRGSAMGNRKDESYFERVREAAGVECTEALQACRSLGLEQCGGRKEGRRGQA